jgi:hypothetical protein
MKTVGREGRNEGAKVCVKKRKKGRKKGVDEGGKNRFEGTFSKSVRGHMDHICLIVGLV